MVEEWIRAPKYVGRRTDPWADPGFQVRGGAQFRWSKSASFTSRGWWEGGDGLGDLDIDIVGVLF